MRLIVHMFFIILFGLCGTSLSGCNNPNTNTNNDIPAKAAKIWALQPSQSYLNFTSVKKNSTVEIHSFSGLQGSITPAGQAAITIDLNTVQTHIDIRNERMKQFLFETSTMPEATVSTHIDMALFAGLAIGEPMDYTLDLQLDLHGVVKSLEANVIITRLKTNKVSVSSREAILIDVADYDLDSGLTKLATLAKLPPITPVVPVNFSLTFAR